MCCIVTYNGLNNIWIHLEVKILNFSELNRMGYSTSLNHVDMDLARASSVKTHEGLLNSAEIALIRNISKQITTAGFTNEQNDTHHKNFKHCVFLNRFVAGSSLPASPIRSLAPRVLAKLLRFAEKSWVDEQWSDANAVLSQIPGPGTPNGGVGGLSIRIAEHWKYEVGGHLDHDLHFDGGSVLTLVVALNDNFQGGTFRTFEPDDTHATHKLAQGDSLCFVSHKYHNVTKVLSGSRESLVIELWQGGGGVASHGR